MYLMATVCANCEGKSDEDIGIIAGFLKIRCKSKPIIDTYFQCLRWMLDFSVDRFNNNVKHFVASCWRGTRKICMLLSRWLWTLSLLIWQLRSGTRGLLRWWQLLSGWSLRSRRQYVHFVLWATYIEIYGYPAVFLGGTQDERVIS